MHPWQVCFSPDGRWVLSASFDKSVKLWDGNKGTFLATFRGHVGPVYQVRFVMLLRYEPRGMRAPTALPCCCLSKAVFSLAPLSLGPHKVYGTYLALPCPVLFPSIPRWPGPPTRACL